MIPWVKDIKVRRGDTKELFFRVRTRTWNEALQKWEPGPYRDLTGWTALSQIRESLDSTIVAAEFTVTFSDQVNPDTVGGVLLKLTPVQTASLTIIKGVWDCQFTDLAGDVWTYVAGAVTVEKDVSRAQ